MFMVGSGIRLVLTAVLTSHGWLVGVGRCLGTVRVGLLEGSWRRGVVAVIVSTVGVGVVALIRAGLLAVLCVWKGRGLVVSEPFLQLPTC